MFAGEWLSSERNSHHQKLYCHSTFSDEIIAMTGRQKVSRCCDKTVPLAIEALIMSQFNVLN